MDEPAVYQRGEEVMLLLRPEIQKTLLSSSRAATVQHVNFSSTKPSPVNFRHGRMLSNNTKTSYDQKEAAMAIDWSQCAAVESIPGKVSGAWVLRGTRMPVQTIIENLEAGLSAQEITELFDVTSDEVRAVLHFVSQSLEKAPS